MNEPFPPWLEPPARSLDERLRRGGLPHALLFAGPRGCGKRRLAEWLVARVLCAAPAPDGSACGNCRECALRRAGTHPDLWRTEPQERADGRLRNEILIEQIRELIAHLAVGRQRGGSSVAVIDPADRLNLPAANALLKTLEEPGAGRLLVLIADEPGRLPATIRSRCTRVELRVPAWAPSLTWLMARGLTREVAEEALRLADGLPLRALELVREGAVSLFAAVGSELRELARGTTSATVLAKIWAGDRPELRLRLAQRLAVDALARRALTDPVLFSKLDAWLGEAGRVRQELSTPLRSEVLIAALLARWPAFSS